MPDALRAFRDLAERTPAHRDRYVDLLRGAAILVVVLGHWLAAAVTVRDGRVDGVNALGVLSWAEPLTWGFQVMPLFFLVGGYVNHASWAGHRRRGGDGADWVRGRMRRLLQPTAVFVGVVTAATLVARGLGADPELVSRTAWAAGISLWFLAVYVAVVALAPALLTLQSRHGHARVLLLLLVVVSTVDIARLALELPYVGSANYLLVWLALHQLGVAWRDGALTGGRGAPWLLAGGGLGTAVLLTVPGPYPLSMVGVPGTTVQNTAPPTLALLAHGIGLAGVALLARPLPASLLARTRPWTVVVAVNATALTVFLWHMVPVVVAAGLLASAGLLTGEPIGTTRWLLLRVPWVLLLAVLLVPLVLAFSRWERPAGGDAAAGGGPVSGPAGTATGVVLCLAALTALAVSGFAGVAPAVLGIPLAEVAAFALGLLLLRWPDRSRRDDDAPGGARPSGWS